MDNTTLFPFTGQEYGILTDSEIKKSVLDFELISKDTFDLNSLEASSYDIKIGNKGVIGGTGEIVDLEFKSLELQPGSYAGVISLEKLKLPMNIIARIGSKRAFSYDGVILLTGSVVDPGYEGYLLFGLYNASQKKVILRKGRKICNTVFERLHQKPEKSAPLDTALKTGNFPDRFIDAMANMDVLPWMQISERVKQIENITKDIIDLKARYDDVLQPIRDLTTNVKTLSKDVESLSSTTKELSREVELINSLVKENSSQIKELTTAVTTISHKFNIAEKNISTLSEEFSETKKNVYTLGTDFGRYKIGLSIIGSIILLLAGSLIPFFLKKVFGIDF